jgi:hypothetical protein
MANNPGINGVILNSAKVFVGPKQVVLRGAADDYFDVSKASDVGSMLTGIQGDTMLVSRIQNGYNCTLTLLQASSAVKTLLDLADSGAPWPISISFDDFNLVGLALVANTGSAVASLGTLTRTITLVIAYQSGDVNSPVGRNAVN